MSLCVFQIPELFYHITTFLDRYSVVQFGMITTTAAVYARTYAAEKAEEELFVWKHIQEYTVLKMCSYFPKISSVCFDDCVFTRPVDLLARQFKNMTSLSILCGKGIEDDLELLRLCTRLERLEITHHTQIAGCCIAQLPQSITELIFLDCGIRNSYIRDFAGLTRLRKLTISYNKYTFHIKSLPITLQHLELISHYFTDGMLRHVSRLTSLQSLNISYSEGIHSDDLYGLPRSLTRLDIQTFVPMSEASHRRLLRLTNLQELNITPSRHLHILSPQLFAATRYRKKDIPTCPLL